MQFSEDKLKQVLANTFEIGSELINEDTSVDTVETWDSLKHLNLILALEAEFDVTFSEEQTVEMLNYPLIKAVLQEHDVQFEPAAISAD